LDNQLHEFAKRVFAGEEKDHQPCQDCGGVHARACPRISAIKILIDDKGVVVERDVRYWAPGTWEDDVTFPEDVWEDDDPGGGDGVSD
jgi:hypothetical protein